MLPHCLKVAKVIALFKKGDQGLPEFYRPLGLLSPLSKVYEKVLLNRMPKFFTENNRFSPNQFGFRANLSCVHAVCELTNYVRDELDKRSNGNCCFTDLNKAFNTVDHDLLLDKLKKNGLRGSIQQLLKHYLLNDGNLFLTEMLVSPVKICCELVSRKVQN